MNTELRKSEFTLYGNKYYNGITMGETWNGFQCPYFEEETAKQIINDLLNDESLNKEDVDPLEYWETININGVIYFGVGHSVYVWEEKEQTIDFSKPVKLVYPNKGEEKLTFMIVNYNEVTNRCYIQLMCDLPIKPTELVSIDDIINIL